MMKTLPIAALVLAMAGTGCANRVDVEKVPVGTNVDVTREDGGVVRGTLAERDDKTVTLKVGSDSRSVPREQIADVQVVADTPTPLPAIARFREYTLPEGTTLSVRLESAIGSDSARMGDPVEAILTDAVVAEGTDVLPAGSVVRGEVAAVHSAGHVKSRASLALLFSSIAVAGRDEPYPIAARASWLAPTTNNKDVATVAIPAAGGAIIGAVIGGKKGALIGTAIGGAAGAGVMVSKAGPQIRLPRGTELSLPLDQPVEIRVPIKKS